MMQPQPKEAVTLHSTNFQEEEEEEDDVVAVDEEAEKEEPAVAVAADAPWDCGSILYDASELVAFTKLLPIIDHADQSVSNIDQIIAPSSGQINRRIRPRSATLSSPSILKKYSSSLQQGPAGTSRDRPLLENCINGHDPDHQKIHGFDASIRPPDQKSKRRNAWSFAKWIRLVKRTLRTGHNRSKQQRCPHEEAIEEMVKHSTNHANYKHHAVHHHHYHHHLLYNSSDDNILLTNQDFNQLDDRGLLFSHKNHDQLVAHKVDDRGLLFSHKNHDQLVAHEVDKGHPHPCNITRAESARLSFETISKLCVDQNWM